MNFDEAVERALPGFRSAAEAMPDKLVVLASVRHNPLEPDGPGRLYIIGHDDIAEIAKLMKLTQVLYFHWAGDFYNVQDDKIIVCLQV